MTKAHTPGPWVETSVDGWDAVKPSGANLAICKLVENNPANARLIAAAPELLEALREATSWIENRLAVEGHPAPRSMSLLSAWLEPIAKATGQAA